MSKFIFAFDSLTCGGKTYPAGYSVGPFGAVTVLVTIPGRDEPARVRFDKSSEDYAAALAAALAAAKAERPAPAPVEAAPVERPAPVEAAPVERPAPAPVEEPAAETVEPAPVEEQPAPRPVPEKTFVGETIKGAGWIILFDAATERTRVIFDGAPSDEARAAVEKAGFFWSPRMGSYNKRLTHRAHRAALALSSELSALYSA